MKTVFIVITRGFIIRNILRSGVLDILLKANIRVVIFFVNLKKTEFPDSLRQEFSRPNVCIEVVSAEKKEKFWKQKFYNIFKSISQFFVFSASTWNYGQIGNKEKMQRNILWAYGEKWIFTFLSKFDFLKRWARFLEEKFFFTPVYSDYFDSYKPDLVFSTSIIATHDMQFMKEAKHRGVKTMSMPKGWDNITKILYRVVPDYIIVQNQIMKEQSKSIQKVSHDNVFVTGFPQFDWYRRPEILLSRKEFFGRLGLPEDRKLIFFGSEGTWAPDDKRVAEMLSHALLEENKLKFPCSMLIRPHYSDVRNNRFEHLKGKPFVKVDDNYNLSDFFIDNWNPTVEETKFFINCIYHCDIMIMIASTLALDAMAFDKPVIGLAYNILYNPKTGEDVSKKWYQTDHMQAVMSTNAVDLVSSDKELIDMINLNMAHPDRKQEERQRLISEVAYKIDGNSSQRMSDVILKALGTL